MMTHRDSIRLQGMRQQMVSMLKEKGISNQLLLQAIGKIPRHLFIERGFEEHAYQDKAFPIGKDQTISNPYTVAFQTQLLEVEEGQKILEIGTGSGYQAAVLVEMGAEVHSIERYEILYKKTKKLLHQLNYIPENLYCGDGYKGLVNQAPFDRIIVTAGVIEPPKSLLSQLKIGGKMVIPIGGEKIQTMTLLTRKSEKEFYSKTFGDFRFVPMLKRVQKEV